VTISDLAVRIAADTRARYRAAVAQVVANDERPSASRPARAAADRERAALGLLELTSSLIAPPFHRLHDVRQQRPLRARRNRRAVAWLRQIHAVDDIDAADERSTPST
jgi:hypothetical protein